MRSGAVQAWRLMNRELAWFDKDDGTWHRSAGAGGLNPRAPGGALNPVVSRIRDGGNPLSEAIQIVDRRGWGARKIKKVLVHKKPSIRQKALSFLKRGFKRVRGI